MDQKDRMRVRLKMKGRRRKIALANRQNITAAEYTGIQLPMRGPRQPQPRNNRRQTLARNKEQQSQQVSPHDYKEPRSGLSKQVSEPPSAKMLIFLQNGEQRLITFTLPKESCTLQEVLEQVNVPFSDDTHIQCMQNTGCEIDYFVSVGCTTRIEEMLENHPMLAGDVSSESSSPNAVQS